MTTLANFTGQATFVAGLNGTASTSYTPTFNAEVIVYWMSYGSGSSGLISVNGYPIGTNINIGATNGAIASNTCAIFVAAGQTITVSTTSFGTAIVSARSLSA